MKNKKLIGIILAVLFLLLLYYTSLLINNKFDGALGYMISNGISNPVVAGIIYWMIRILISGGCLVGVGILLSFIEIKIAGLYKKYCWDMITILVTLISLEIAIYFGDWIKAVLPVNLLFLLLFVQLVYVGIRWYVKGWRETRGYY